MQFPMWDKVTKIYVMGSREGNLELSLNIESTGFRLVLSPLVTSDIYLCNDLKITS
jgi:hypothetical protein